MLAYVDTSAALKLLVQEAESNALKRWLTDTKPALVTSSLLGVEMARTCLVRAPEKLGDAANLAASVIRIPIGQTELDSASLVRPDSIRSLDAIHLGTAILLRASLDLFLTYDKRLADAARFNGLRVISPGADI